MKIKDIKSNKEILYLNLVNRYQYLQCKIFQTTIQEKNKLFNNIVSKNVCVLIS